MIVLLFKGLRPPAAGPPEEEGHEDTRPRGYEATGLEPRLEGLLGAFWGPPGGLLGASWGPLGASWGTTGGGTEPRFIVET